AGVLRRARHGRLHTASRAAVHTCDIERTGSTLRRRVMGADRRRLGRARLAGISSVEPRVRRAEEARESRRRTSLARERLMLNEMRDAMRPAYAARICRMQCTYLTDVLTNEEPSVTFQKKTYVEQRARKTKIISAKGKTTMTGAALAVPFRFCGAAHRQPCIDRAR